MISRKLVGAVLGLTALLATMTLLFGLPAVNSGPDGLPVGVVGPAQALPPVYDVTTYADEASLRRAIEERDVVGGVMVGPSPRVLVASAGSPVIAQHLRAVATRVGADVEDVVAPGADDPAGAGISSTGLPLIIGGLLPAFAFSRLFRRQSLRIGGALLFASVAGLTIAALLQFAFGTTDENFLLMAGGLALGMAAMGVFALGMESLLGDAGFGVAAATIVLVGNPLSGLATSPDWLPAGWSDLGRLLPPGATGTVLRSNAFFDGHGAGAAALVLTVWLMAGLALTFAASRRRA
jgi:hypothetical protein